MMNNEQSIMSDICAMTGSNLEAVFFSDYDNQENMIITSERIGDLGDLDGTLCYNETTNEYIYVNMNQPNLNPNDLSTGTHSVFSILGNTTSPSTDLATFNDGNQIMLLNSSIVIPSEDDGLIPSGQDQLLLQFVQNSTEPEKENDRDKHFMISRPDDNGKNKNCDMIATNEDLLLDPPPVINEALVQDSDLNRSEIQYDCVLCTKSFNDMKDYRIHVLSHKEKTHKCNYCGNSFNKYKNLILHEVIHNPNDMTCPLTSCQKKFRRLASLKAHIKIHEEEETLACSECGEEFRNQMYLELHYKYQPQCRVSDIEPHVTNHKTCKICNRKFNNFSTLAAHKKEHEKIKKALATKSHKKKTASSKQSQRMNRCKVCPKWFHKPSQLERHMRIHTGERPFQCTQCPKAFNQQNSLKIHMLKHTGDRPYLCPFCHSGFSQRGNLRQHINRVHSIPKVEDHVYECSECPCNFKKICSLNAHRNRVHQQKCKLPVAEASDLNRHTQENYNTLNEELQDSDECDNDLGDAPNIDEELQTQSKNGKANENYRQDKVYICMKCPRTFHEAVDLRAHRCDSSVISSNGTDDEETITSENNLNAVNFADFETGTPMNSIIIGIDRGNGELWDQTVFVTKRGDTSYYKCSHCTKQSTKLSEVIKHIKINVVGKLFKCEYCAKTFNQHSVFLTHLKLHATAQTYSCSKCNENFSNPAELSVHSKTHAQTSCDYMCMLCCQSYSLKEGEKHQCTLPDPMTDNKIEIRSMESGNGRLQKLQDKINLILPPYNCSRCNITFPSYSKLKSHLQDHDGKLCKLCFSIFVCKESYVDHMNNNHKDHMKNLTCNLCDKQFRTKHRRDQHMKSHREDAPKSETYHKCSKCDKSFNDTKSLSIHKSKDHIILLDDGLIVPRETVVPVLNLEYGETDCTDADIIDMQNNVSDFIITNTEAISNGTESSNREISTINYSIPVPDHLSINPTLSIDHTVPNLVDAQIVNDEKQDNALAINGSLLNKTLLDASNDKLSLPNKNDFSYVISNEALDECFASNEVSVLADDTNFNGELPMYEVPADVIYKCTKCNLHCSTEIELQKHFNESEICSNGLPITTFNYFYACNTCFLTFNTLPTFLRHLQTHNGNGTYSCLYCNTPNRNEAELTQHIAQHASKNEYLCIHCGELTTSSEAVKKHIIETHLMSSSDSLEAKRRKSASSDIILSEKEKLLLVDQKPNKFSSISQKVLSSLLRKGVRKDDDKHDKTSNETQNDIKVKKKSSSSKENICSFCGRKFKKTCDLVRHVRTHTGEKPYKCDYCNKCFSVKSILNGHLKRHFTVNNICCHICSRFFSTVGSLKIHMRLHTGDRPYKCAYCKESFRTSGHRESHQKRHSAEKEKEQATLVSDIIEIGNNNRLQLPLGDAITVQSENFLIPEIQDVPNFKFLEVMNLENLTVPSIENNRSVSGKVFKNKTKLNKNLSSLLEEREFLCNICETKFSQLSSLKAHLQTHIPSQVQCDVCQKTFASAKNFKAHKIRQHPETLNLPFQDDNGLILDAAIPLLNGTEKTDENDRLNKWNEQDVMNLANLAVKSKKNDLSDFFIVEKQFDLNSMISDFFPDDEKSELNE